MKKVTLSKVAEKKKGPYFSCLHKVQNRLGLMDARATKISTIIVKEAFEKKDKEHLGRKKV